MQSLQTEFAHKVEQLEGAMLKLPQAECSVVHRFSPGLYIREVRIPADTYAIGHYQKTTHLNVMLQGRVTMVDEVWKKHELRAPQTFIAGPGRKIGYVHEDMVWLNIYATTETDIEKLEAHFLHKSETWTASQPLLSNTEHMADVDDYYAALAEMGIAHDTAREQSLCILDQCPFPPGVYKVRVAPSAIEGQGLFATASIAALEVIAPARISGLRTPAGRYTNHAAQPNARMRSRANGDIDLIAMRDIAGSRGGQLGEEITIDYRAAIRENLLAMRKISSL